jgi:DNA-binding response OmpR family regulator
VSAAKTKVLICDDDPLLLELMEFRLQAKGYEVVKAADGAEALSLVGGERPDIVVLDAMMPKSDGFEVLARIKNDPDLSAIPVVMLTARKGEKDIVSALEKGADDYLVKPFIPEELLARLARLVSRRQGRRG